MSPLIIILIAMILCMTTGQCRIFHDLPTFIENVPTTFNFNYLPAKIKMQIISEVQTAQLLTCLRVSKLFYSLIFGPVLFATTHVNSHAAFRQFLRHPKMEKLGRSIRTLVINISSIIDQKHLDERTPTRVQEEMDRLDPAWNRDSDLKKRIEPLRKWHGSRLVMNIKLLTKLLTKKDAFPFLQYLHILINNTRESRQVVVPLEKEFLEDIVRRFDAYKGFQVTLFRFDEDEHEIVATMAT